MSENNPNQHPVHEAHENKAFSEGLKNLITNSFEKLDRSKRLEQAVNDYISLLNADPHNRKPDSFDEFDVLSADAILVDSQTQVFARVCVDRKDEELKGTEDWLENYKTIEILTTLYKDPISSQEEADTAQEMDGPVINIVKEQADLFRSNAPEYIYTVCLDDRTPLDDLGIETTIGILNKLIQSRSGTEAPETAPS